MTIGKSRKRFTIKKYTVSRGAGGSQVRTLESLGTVWGELRPLQGDERLDGLRLERPVTARIFVRYQEAFMDADVATEAYNGGERQYRIRSSRNPDITERFIEFLVERGSDL